MAVDDDLGEYILHRAFQRAGIDAWVEDLAAAGRLLLDLANELDHQGHLQRRLFATAGDLLPHPRILAADFRLHELRGVAGTYEARLIACGPLGRGAFERFSDPAFTVAILKVEEIERVASFLRGIAARMAAWNLRFTGGKRKEARAGARGRLPDVAAARIVQASRQRGLPLKKMAQAAIEIGIETLPARDGDDPAAKLADRWRKAAKSSPTAGRRK